MRPALRLGLVLAAAEIGAVASPLLSAPIRAIVAVACVATLMIMSLFVLGRSAWRVQLASLGVATAIVAVWTIVRVVAMHDSDVVRIALAIDGMVIVLVGLAMLMASLQRRGWIRESVARRRIVWTALMAATFVYFVGAPAEPWNGRVRLVFTSIAVIAIFWPARQSARRITLPTT